MVKPIALGIQPPQQIDPMRTLAGVNQMRQSQRAASLADYQMQQAQAKQGALSQYAQTGDPGALAMYPGEQNKAMQYVMSLEESKRDKEAHSIVQRAGAARSVLGAPEEKRTEIYQQKLGELREAGHITDEAYEARMNQPPSTLWLNDLVNQAVPVEDWWKARQPTSRMQEADYVSELVEPTPGEAPEDLAARRTAAKREHMSKSGVSVNIGQKQESKRVSERIGTIEDQVDAAQDLDARYTQIIGLLEQPGVYTGTAGETIANLTKAGRTLFGMDLEGVGPSTAAKKVANQAVAAIKRDMQDPRMSDADRKFYQSIPPNIGDDAEGARLFAEIVHADRAFKEQVQDKLYDLIEANPDNLPKAHREFRRWRAKQNRWTPELVKRLSAKAKTMAKQKPPTAGAEKLIEKYRLEPQ